MVKDTVLPAALFVVLLVVLPFCLTLDFLAPLERAITRLAERRALACGLVFLFSLAVSAGMTREGGVPPPSIHDEFSYLLAGDTFAHGRMTNPTHPLWRSFDTFFELQQPSYQSKYPPGQGLSLAVGEALFGLPIVGVWLTTALSCAALCWMLMAWMSPRWGLAGGLLAALNPMVLQWSQCYWGGSLAFAGGALLFGGVRRVVDGGRLRDGAAMGMGAAILALARPYEGALMVAYALLPVVWLVVRGGAGAPGRTHLLKAAGGFAVPVLLALVFTGYYDYRVTGSPTRMPYAVYEALYTPVPSFILQQLRAMPPLRNEIIYRANVEDNIPQYVSETGSPRAVILSALKKTALVLRYALLSFNIHYYTAPPFDPGLLGRALQWMLAVPLLALPLALERDAWTRYAVWGLAVGMVGLYVQTWIFPHYAAPWAPLLAVVLLQCLRALRSQAGPLAPTTLPAAETADLPWKREVMGGRMGRSLARTLAALYVVSFFASAHQFLQMRADNGWAYERVALTRRLEAMGGKQLVVVQYGPRHSVDQEWVYNAADIDGSQVVWARDLDPAQNARLLGYFHDRKTWLLQPDVDPAKLIPIRPGGPKL